MRPHTSKRAVDPSEVSSPPVPSPAIIVPPPLVFLGTFALGLLGARWLGFGPHAGDTSWLLRVVGIALIGFGVGVAVSALALFARARTTIIPHGQAAALVTSGPYRWTRNPMYVSLTALYLGAAAIMGALGPVVTLPLALLVISLAVIPHEERGLTRVFGAEYTAYCDRVRRWL